MPPCGQHSPGVGAGVDRHARLVRRHDRLAAAGVQVGHRGGVRRELLAAAAAYSGKLSSCTTVGTSAVPRSTIASIRSVVRPVPCSMQSMPASISAGQHRLAEAVRGHPGAVLVGASIAAANASAGNDGARSPDVAGDPVAHELDPAVAALRLLGDVRREVLRLDLVGVVADVALGARDVAARADQPRQVVAVVDPRGVDRRAAVAEQQRPGVAVGHRLLLGRRLVDAAVRVEPDVAVRVDQARHDPPSRGLGRPRPSRR